MLKAIINNQRQYEVEVKSEQTLINHQDFSYQLSLLADNRFHLLHTHQSYNVEVIKTDFPRKEFLLKINGKRVKVNLQDRFDQLIETMGLQEDDAQSSKEILAPMPGLILQVHVKEGDEVSKGDSLLTLEAMKMENVLKSPGDGVIKKVHAEIGKSVEKNQQLIVLE